MDKPQSTTTKKEPKKPRRSSSSTYYLIHVYQDKDMLIHLHSPAGSNDYKKAKETFTDLIATDLMHNRYYFYEFIEQTMKTIEVYPK